MSSPLRLHVPQALSQGQILDLPPGAVRHVQVRRLQPGDPLVVFDGQGGQWGAELLQMGRQSAQLRLGPVQPVLPELPCAVTLALGVPANERMDTLVEKATELGVACLQPLITERSVLRLDGDRAAKRRAHWQAIAAAASEQCGRATVPEVLPMMTLPAWLQGLPAALSESRCLLWPADPSQPLRGMDLPGSRLLALSGPEGGLTLAEARLALDAGFRAVSLGPRVLRADTAPLALMAWVSLLP
ncbi:MAG: 16S rRNA (uracil(1498)-N(3))-methyltransferase [Rubrivivax sp.]|nr:16S rRNA (uracil(1498)-N(3))-methyltransferase [Rubrivivax sp.]